MKKEVIQQLSALVTAAFGLVAALAWNSAVQEVFNQLFGERASIATMFFYAISVTAIAIIATIWIGWAAERANNLELSKLKVMENLEMRKLQLLKKIHRERIEEKELKKKVR